MIMFVACSPSRLVSIIYYFSSQFSNTFVVTNDGQRSIMYVYTVFRSVFSHHHPHHSASTFHLAHKIARRAHGKINQREKKNENYTHTHNHSTQRWRYGKAAIAIVLPLNCHGPAIHTHTHSRSRALSLSLAHWSKYNIMFVPYSSLYTFIVCWKFSWSFTWTEWIINKRVFQNKPVLRSVLCAANACCSRTIFAYAACN